MEIENTSLDNFLKRRIKVLFKGTDHVIISPLKGSDFFKSQDQIAICFHVNFFVVLVYILRRNIKYFMHRMGCILLSR